MHHDALFADVGKSFENSIKESVKTKSKYAEQ